MATRNVLAFDFGASSGRAILGRFDGAKITLQETHRFANEPVQAQGRLQWDVLRLLHETRQGLAKSYAAAPYASFSIDTWGVDYGLLDARGRLLENPVHYRDGRTAHAIEEVCARIPRQALYARTGTQLIHFNTLFQLHVAQQEQPQLLALADRLLFMPDLLAYFLTGEKYSEFSIASTSQLLSPGAMQWNTGLLAQLGLPSRLLGPLVDAGARLGGLTDETCELCGIPPAEYIACCAHDTASAVAAVPQPQGGALYISSGTWSLMGVERRAPLLTAPAAQANVTNEGGYGRSIRLLKNIAGLWLLQECRRQWRKEGLEFSFADMAQAALAAPAFARIIDPDDPCFMAPGNMPARIADYCRCHGMTPPQTIGETLRCVYESLAARYALTLGTLQQLTGLRYPAIHIVGGGCQDRVLSQWTADACGLPVSCGPVEATATGNLMVQLIALGELEDLSQGREMVARSFAPVTYAPHPAPQWDEALARLAALQP